MENQSEAKQEIERADTSAWYIVRSATRREAQAEVALRAEGFGAYCPRLIRWGYRARQGKVRVDQPVFAGYLFVELVGAPRFDLVRAADGVHAFLTRSGHPASIPTIAVEKLRRREAAGEFDKTRKRCMEGPFHAGQQVAVVAGKFTDWPARVIEMSGPDRVRLLLEAFGRSHEQVLPVAALRTA